MREMLPAHLEDETFPRVLTTVERSQPGVGEPNPAETEGLTPTLWRTFGMAASPSRLPEAGQPGG